MAAIVQTNLFSWDAVEALSNLDSLTLIRDHLPDERLVQYLELMRGHGRDDYPMRAMWNLLLAGVVFQHESPESRLRELSRNPSLMEACGFDLLTVARAPKPCVVADVETGVSRIERAAGGARLCGPVQLERLALSGECHRVGRESRDGQRDGGDAARAAHGGLAGLRPAAGI